jgi:hypothetical protein
MGQRGFGYGVLAAARKIHTAVQRSLKQLTETSKKIYT